MDDTRKQRLIAADIDVDSALARFMNNEALFERFLGKFPADDNYGKLTAAIASGDRDTALTASHTLKGVSGNLSLTALYDLTDRQVKAMRADDWDAACAMMGEITAAYEKAVGAITAE